MRKQTTNRRRRIPPKDLSTQRRQHQLTRQMIHHVLSRECLVAAPLHAPPRYLTHGHGTEQYGTLPRAHRYMTRCVKRKLLGRPTHAHQLATFKRAKAASGRGRWHGARLPRRGEHHRRDTVKDAPPHKALSSVLFNATVIHGSKCCSVVLHPCCTHQPSTPQWCTLHHQTICTQRNQ